MDYQFGIMVKGIQTDGKLAAHARTGENTISIATKRTTEFWVAPSNMPTFSTSDDLNATRRS